MIRGVFPRFFSQKREGALIEAKWSIASGVATKLEGHNDLSLDTFSSGLSTIRLAGGARSISVVAMHNTLIDQDDPVDARTLHINQEGGGIDADAGTIAIAAVEAGNAAESAEAVANPEDTSQVHVILWVAK